VNHAANTCPIVSIGQAWLADSRHKHSGVGNAATIYNSIRRRTVAVPLGGVRCCRGQRERGVHAASASERNNALELFNGFLTLVR